MFGATKISTFYINHITSIMKQQQIFLSICLDIKVIFFPTLSFALIDTDNDERREYSIGHISVYLN